MRDSTATSRGGGGDGGGSGRSAAADEEGLGLLRQQLSAVQRIRVEHERKDAAIAALRLEVRASAGGGWMLFALRVVARGVLLKGRRGKRGL